MLPVPDTTSVCPAATDSREVPVVGRTAIVPESDPPSSKASVASPAPKEILLDTAGLSERLTMTVAVSPIVIVPLPAVPVVPPSPSCTVPSLAVRPPE